MIFCAFLLCNILCISIVRHFVTVVLVIVILCDIFVEVVVVCIGIMRHFVTVVWWLL